MLRLTLFSQCMDQYPLPRPEDPFAILAGGKKFSQLDLADAYQQGLLDKQSFELVTANAHKGYTGLPGVPLEWPARPPARRLYSKTSWKIL